MKYLIITGGRIQIPFALSFIENHHFDKVIAVDAGMEAAQKLHLVPDYIVGDFDTVNPAVRKAFEKISTIRWEIHQPEKDETDTELALRIALERDAEHITILGALGGRMDHELVNIQLLMMCLKKKVYGQIIDEQNRLYLLDHGKTFRKADIWGKYISFLCLGEEIKGITLHGFKYPLNQFELTIGTSRCISNELAADEGTLEFTSGILLCMECHD